MAHDAMINNILKYDFEEDSMLDETNFGSNQTDYILSSLSEIIKEKMLELCMIWVEIGIPKSKRINRLDEVKSLVEEQTLEVFNTIKETERKTLNDLKNYRVSKLKEINKIQNDLKIPPYELPSNINLFNTAKILHYKFEDLNKLKKERITKWTDLKTQKSQLATQLGCPNKSFNLDTGIPSEEEVMQLQTYVLDLKKLKEEREQEVEQFKEKFERLFSDLEYAPSNDYEKQFFDNKQFILSDVNMKQLPRLLEKLNSMYEQNKLTKSLRMEKLNSLWKKLSIDDEEQQNVRYVIEVDCKPSTLEYMQTKIDELEELKRQNIGSFVAKLRPEIEEWWEKCCISEEKVASFADKYFTITDVDDQILEIHENELERLQKFYCENESIFVKCNKWKEFIHRLNELEIKSKDPNRFNNRGGALLQEEKERKQLVKGIPKLENELKQLAKDWSTRNDDQIFTIYGKPIEVYFTEYYESLQIQKENEKEKKKIIKKQELEMQSRLMVNSPCRSEKTKRIVSQTASSAKRFKPLGLNRNQAGISKPTTAATTSRKGVVKSLKPEFTKRVEADVQIEINTIINESQFQSIKKSNKTIGNKFGFQSSTPSSVQKNKSIVTRRMTRSAAAQNVRNPLTPMKSSFRNTPSKLQSSNAILKLKHSPMKRTPVKSPLKRSTPIKRF